MNFSYILLPVHKYCKFTIKHLKQFDIYMYTELARIGGRTVRVSRTCLSLQICPRIQAV